MATTMHTNAEIIKDLAEALLRLTEQMERHYLGAPLEIGVSRETFDKVRSIRPDYNFISHDPTERGPAVSIVGVKFVLANRFGEPPLTD